MSSRPPPLNLERQLQAVPVRNARVRNTPGQPPGVLRLEAELTYPGWRGVLAAWLRPGRRRSYELSGIGREVYEMIDGQRTFEDLVDAFAAAHALTFMEARALLQQFVRTLMARGLVAVVVA